MTRYHATRQPTAKEDFWGSLAVLILAAAIIAALAFSGPVA